MISLLYVLLKGSLMNKITPKPFDVDLGTAMIAYVLISFGSTWAGVFALCQGIITDLFSAGPLGLFPLLYLIVFLSIQWGCRFFDLHSSSGVAILVCIAVCLKSSILLLLLGVFSYSAGGSSSIMVLLGASAVATGLISPVCFHVLNRLRRVFMTRI
jgi:cell shape-determining protein MreD